MMFEQVADICQNTTHKLFTFERGVNMAWTKIAVARKAKGWTQSDLARRMGISQQQVARWETSDGDIKASALVNIAEALGVTVSYLLGVDVSDGDIRFEDERTHDLTLMFNSVSPESRDALFRVAKGLYELDGPKKEVP